MEELGTPNSMIDDTNLNDFRELAKDRRVVPVVRTLLADSETPLSTYRKLSGNRAGTFLLESAEHGRSWSRYSFIGARSQSALTAKNGAAVWFGDVPVGVPSGGNPLDVLAATLELLHTEPLAGLPPLTSGLIGFLSYDIVRRLEKLPTTTIDDLHVPELMLMLATDMAVFDHYLGRITLIANAVNWNGTNEGIDGAYDDAKARLDAMTADLAADSSSTVSTFSQPEPVVHRQVSQEEFSARIEAAKEDIRAGEAFQIVLSQRFEEETQASAIDIYRILRASNPSPYMFLLNIPSQDGNGEWHTEFSIVGSSPEALVTVKGQEATLHPLAGSRPRGVTPEDDDRLVQELLADEKENSEHLMLVDLGRNDLGRVCQPGTVRVTEFSHVERFSHVMHIVSTVTGTLYPSSSAFDTVLACFPAGTLTGAPKPRAMELIDEYEDTRRGVYAGTVGYFDFAGNADQAIAIRAGLVRDGRVYVQAGAGIVADSQPLLEDAETRNKAMAVLNAVAAANTLEVVEP